MMTRSLAVCLYALVVAVAVGGQAQQEDYSSYRLYRVDLSDSSNPHEIVSLLNDKFDVWGRHPNKHNRFEIDVFGQVEVEDFLQKLNLHPRIVRANIQASIERERARLSSQKNVKNEDWFLDYHRLNDSLAWYQQYASTYPRLVTYVPSIGKTWEGRDLVAVRVTSDVGTNKKQVWIQANIHAREWITSAAIQFFFNRTVTSYGSDSRVTRLLDSTELIIIPYVNPDGFDYTWTNYRLWRKNRRVNGDGSYGVDLNRNADSQWGGVGSSGIPSSDTYRGPSPASEPETQALTAYLLTLPNIVACADIHSYGQLILRPFSYTPQDPSYDPQTKLVGDAIRAEIFAIHNKVYTSDNWYNGLYASSGVIMDWWAERNIAGNRPYAFTIELRPTDDSIGFELPPEEIIPTGEELAAGLLYYAEYASANPLPFST